MTRWKVRKLPDLVDKVSRTKGWSSEKTDSKVIETLIRFGYKYLFGDKNT